MNDTLDPITQDDHEVPQGVGPVAPTPTRGQTSLRRHIFDHVRAQGRASRADVARALGISAASVTALTADLIGLGLLREVEGAPLERGAGRGRPPVALEIVPEGRHIIGVKLGDERHTAVLSDFGGRMLGEAARPAASGRRPLGELLDEVEALVADLQEGAVGRAVMAVGIGLPGLVDHGSGRVAWSPLLQGTDVGLAGAVAGRLGCPAQIDNDANLLTLAELWFGAGRALSDFAVVTIEHGVGMGLVQGGRLFRGARGMGM